MSELVNQKNYGNFLEKVLELDQDIRYVVVFNGKYHAKFRGEIIGYFKEDEIKSSFSETQNRWKSQYQTGFKIGDPRFTMTQYSKENRIIFPIGNEEIILVSTKLDIDVNKLVDKIIELRHNSEYNLTGFFYR
jgi:hypothetical protein